MNTKIFAYCERGSDPAFWAEPLNALTNCAFIIAALIALWLWGRSSDRRGIAELLLILLVFVIGVGSFLFHTYATRWAVIADTAPIGIFMVAYLAYALRRYLRWHWLAVIAGLAVFFVALWQARTIRCDGGACLNGSVGYLPAFAALILIGGALLVRGHPAGRYVFGAGIVFAVSLTFRTLDRILCPQTTLIAGAPLGTHFMWHILNAVLLYLLLHAALVHASPKTPRPGCVTRR